MKPAAVVNAAAVANEVAQSNLRPGMQMETRPAIRSSQGIDP